MTDAAAPREVKLDLPFIDPHYHFWDRPKAAPTAPGGSAHPFAGAITKRPRYLLAEPLGGPRVYGVLWSAFKRLAAGFSEVEIAKRFSGTARDIYRLQEVD